MSIVMDGLVIDGVKSGNAVIVIDQEREILRNCELKRLTLKVRAGLYPVAVACTIEDVAFLMEVGDRVEPIFINCYFSNCDTSKIDAKLFKECVFANVPDAAGLTSQGEK